MTGFRSGQEYRQQQELIDLKRQQMQQQMQAEQQAQQAAIQQQEQMSQVMERVRLGQAGPADYAFAAGLNKEQGMAIKDALDRQDKTKKEAVFSSGLPVWSALKTGKIDFAKQLLDRDIEAATNAGDMQRAQGAKVFRDMLDAGPEGVAMVDVALGSSLSAADPERFGKSAESLLKGVTFGATAREAEAKAKTAEVDARYAEPMKQWAMEQMKSDIDFKKQSAKIQMMQAAAARENNDLKRQELQLKIEDMRAAQASKITEKVTEFETGLANVNDVRALISDIKSDPESLAAATGMSWWKGSIPGTENKAMALKIERLQNALTMNNLDKLKGAVSDKDIAFLKSASTTLDRAQDEKEFRRELDRVGSTIERAYESLHRKMGIPLPKKVSAADIPGQTPSRPSIFDEADAIIAGKPFTATGGR